MELKHQLTPQLKHLRLSGILETLDARNRQAIEGQWSYVEFLSRLAWARPIWPRPWARSGTIWLQRDGTLLPQTNGTLPGAN